MLTSICSNTLTPPSQSFGNFSCVRSAKLQLTLICLSQLVLHSNYPCLWSAGIKSQPF